MLQHNIFVQTQGRKAFTLWPVASIPVLRLYPARSVL
jgi:hypothetical protein